MTWPGQCHKHLVQVVNKNAGNISILIIVIAGTRQCRLALRVAETREAITGNDGES